MNYLLSEDELNQLDDLRSQIGLMLDLAVAIVNKPEISISIESLTATLSDYQGKLKAVLRALNERADAERVLAEGVGAMHWFDWAHALRIATGDARHTPAGAAESISRKLAAAATIDPDWRAVEVAWHDAHLRQYGPQSASPTPATTRKPAGGTKPRKRERLTANA